MEDRATLLPSSQQTVAAARRRLCAGGPRWSSKARRSRAATPSRCCTRP